MRRWNPRDSRRWGSSGNLLAAPGALDFTSEQLVSVERIEPCAWNIAARIAGVDAADLAVVSFRIVVQGGVGSARLTHEFEWTPTTATGLPQLGSVALFPTDSFSVQLRAVGAVALGGDWRFAAWAAPTVPLSGLHITLEDEDE